MKNLFIDTNIWLSLYNFTKDDLSQFEKLKKYIGNSINLIIPRQVYNEILRNRENKLKNALNEFVIKSPNYPVFAKGYEEYDDFKKDMDNLESRFKSWKKKIDNDISNDNLPADKTISEFFIEENMISCEELVDLAYKRYRMGNPPGKDNKYGDAIIWESLLKNVPDNQDLYIISSDKDYRSIIEDKKINPFLKKEWESKKQGTIKFYTQLVDFLNEHTKDIVLETEIKKQQLIKELKESTSFQSTHGIIAMLNKHSGWNESQIDELCKCVEENNQVGWIFFDKDVYDFYKKLLSKLKLNSIDNSNIANVKTKLEGFENELIRKAEKEFEDHIDAESDMMEALEDFYFH